VTEVSVARARSRQEVTEVSVARARSRQLVVTPPRYVKGEDLRSPERRLSSVC
jgi:hypothetical protein